MLPTPPNPSDLAVLRALLGWGGPEAARAWDRLGAGWRERLEAVGTAVEEEPEAARSALRREHAASARPDPAHIHPSWWGRALQYESPAVRRAVAAHAASEIAAVVEQDLLLDAADLRPDRPPHPEALQWVLTLWTERLVGELAARPDDPPVIAVLTQVGPHDLYHLVHVTGLAKLSYAIPKTPRPEDFPALRPRDLIRIEKFRSRWGQPDPQLARIAALDLDETADILDRTLSPLGLITISRLLAVADPHRARWVLQHLPYPVVRWMRPRITLKNPLVSRQTLLAWEAEIFQAAVEWLPAAGGDGDEGGDPV